MTNRNLAPFAGIDDQTVTRMNDAWASAPIEWHCSGRHGVIRGVSKTRWQETQKMLEWFLGVGCCHWQKESADTFAVEFVHMCKVFPPPRKPWEWCGETVLFGEWKLREQATRHAVRTFRVGERVSFEAKGRIKIGLVAGVNQKTVAVLVEDEGRWRVSPQLLTKVA